MKIDCGLSARSQQEVKENWHRWFAWYPVMIVSHDCRWLEWVERRISYEHYGYDNNNVTIYRAITKEPT